MTDRLGIVRRRLHEQRLAAEPFGTPGDAVAWFGAVQAQELAEVKWSLGERVRECVDSDVEDALARGDILRTHLLRPTWHFVAAADIRWMLALTAPRVHRAAAYGRRTRGLDGPLLARADDVLAEALRDSQPQTRNELGAALARAGIEATGPRLAHILIHAELEQVLCSGPLRAKQHTYALLDDRAPSGPQLSTAQALAELARRYLRSHGPATLTDFAWWSGLTRTQAREGIEAIAGELVSEEDDSGVEWLAFSRPDPPRAATGAFLIPTYDELTVAYRDLRMVYAVAPAEESLWNRPVVIDGVCVGSWARTLSARQVTVNVSLGAELDGEQAAALQAVVERFGTFLGRPATLQTE